MGAIFVQDGRGRGAASWTHRRTEITRSLGFCVPSEGALRMIHRAAKGQYCRWLPQRSQWVLHSFLKCSWQVALYLPEALCICTLLCLCTVAIVEQGLLFRPHPNTSNGSLHFNTQKDSWKYCLKTLSPTAPLKGG